jgi:hypothetical protein
MPNATAVGPATVSIATDAESDVAGLRDQYRPKRVVTLFVGESSPAQGTHFYRADSNLYRATQAAFAAALGESVVPTGVAFLKFFASKGCWLVDLAEGPVNNLPATERKLAVDAGIPRLAELIAETRPKHLVVIKSDIAKPVQQAIDLAGARKLTLLTLRYPLRQWRSVYVKELGMFIKEQMPMT